jgi:uncharacterized protein YcbX
MAQIERLFIYPVKSCAPVEVQRIDLDDLGPVGDRRFMLVNEQGKFLTQRQLPAMARIEAQWLGRELHLSWPGQSQHSVSMSAERCDVEVWGDVVSARLVADDTHSALSDFLGRACRLVQMDDHSQRAVAQEYAGSAARQVGFADGFPLLVVNQASVDFLSERLGREIDVRRFRPNVVINDPNFSPLEENQWRSLGIDGGSIDLVKLCTRCVIPTRDLTTLEREADFLDVLKNDCRIDGKIIFGQNGLHRNMTGLSVGQAVTVER